MVGSSKDVAGSANILRDPATFALDLAKVEIYFNTKLNSDRTGTFQKLPGQKSPGSLGPDLARSRWLYGQSLAQSRPRKAGPGTGSTIEQSRLVAIQSGFGAQVHPHRDTDLETSRETNQNHRTTTENHQCRQKPRNLGPSYVPYVMQ